MVMISYLWCINLKPTVHEFKEKALQKMRRYAGYLFRALQEGRNVRGIPEMERKAQGRKT